MPNVAAMVLTRVLALVAAGAACAQAIPSAPPIAVGQHSAGVFAHDGVLVGAARRWRATFGERTVTFQPALGKAAPRAHTFGLTLRSVCRGDHRLAPTDAPATLPPDSLPTDALPTRTHDRSTVRYDWPGLREVFDVRPEGLELSFVFDARPAGDGDLVVALDVATDLTPSPDGAQWLDHHHNGVTIGAVTGFDGEGRRCIGERHLGADGTLELRLPAAFVERAAYPITLDPLIGTAASAYAGVDADFPDVAFDAFSGTWCVVWTQFLGGGQTGVVGSVFTASPLAFGYAFGINTTGDADSVRVTSIGGTGAFVLVWVTYTAAGNLIEGLAFEPVQTLNSGLFQLDGPYDVWGPILSGEATVYDDDCLVAWQDASYGLLGCTVAVDAQLQASATPIALLAAGNVAEPAFSKQGGDAGRHLLTWVDRPPGSPGRVRAQVVDHDLNLLGPGAWIQNTPQNAGFPAVDGDGFQFLVAWEEQEVGNPSTTDVRAKVVTVGPNGITSIGSPLDIAAVPGQWDYAVDVALLGDQRGIAWMSADPAQIYRDDCHVRTFTPAGAPLAPAQRLDVTTVGSYAYEHAPRLCGRRDGDPSTSADDGLLVFADQANTAPFDSDIGVQAIEALGPGGPIVDLGGGCGPGGLAASNGPFALGNPAAPLGLYAAQPLAIPFVLFGAPGARVGCGVCAFVDPIAVWFVPNTAGTATTSVAIPGHAALVGASLDCQFLSLNVLYVGCPALPGTALSNVLRFTIDL